jgi:small ligand-binding sensory domain FIST
MRWATSIATATEHDMAIDEVVDGIASQLGPARPDLVMAFVTDHLAPGFGRLSSEIARKFPGAAVAGCTAGGAIGGGVEVEHRPALALVAASMPGASARAWHLASDPGEWPSLNGDHTDAAAVIVLPCPLSSPVEDLLAWCDERWPNAVKVGGLASGGMTTRGPAGNTLFAGEERHREGAVVVTLSGDVAVDTIVAQGCRPIGDPLVVTKGLGNVVLELDGMPALRALEAIHATLPPDEKKLCRHSLFVGVVPDSAPPTREVRRRDVLIRNLIGCDRAAGALAVGAPVHVGQIIQFHLRTAEASAEDLAELLAEPHAPSAGALLFSCVGRGQLLYGRPNHDSDVFRRALGEIPLGGFFCNGEVGPVAGKTFLHGYTSAFALFRKRAAQA